MFGCYWTAYVSGTAGQRRCCEMQGSPLPRCCGTVPSLAAAGQRRGWALQDSAWVGRCRVALYLGAAGQHLNLRCKVLLGSLIETHGERAMLWGSVLVWLAGYKSNGHSPPSTQLATSLGTTDLYQERSSRITSTANMEVCSRIVSYLVFLCVSVILVFKSYFSWSHLKINQVALL